MLKPDPAIDEVREARRRISARFDHDPARLIDHYIKMQDEHRERLFKEPVPTVSRKSVA
jgi:hypothetical protein